MSRIIMHLALIFMSALNFGIWAADPRDVSTLPNLIVGILCLVVAYLGVRHRRWMQKMDTEILFMQDQIDHQMAELRRDFPYAAEAYTYANQHYSAKDAMTILKTPKFMELLKTFEKGDHSAPTAPLIEVIDEMAAAIGAERITP